MAGRLVRDFDKFGIGYSEGDKQLYLQYEGIRKIYDAILDFIDRIFLLESQVGTDFPE